MRRALVIVAAALAGSAARAQTDIDPDHKWSWSENAGWMNWADADDGAQGVQVEASYLSGWIWCENVGWVTVGDGTPGGAGEYTNDSGEDHGVNIGGNGDLSGFAWGENIGWINFDTVAQLGDFDQQARFDSSAGRFRGYAWGENVGWINLDDAEHYVGVGGGCEADCDGNGQLNILDFVCFQAEWEAQTAFGDCDGNSSYNILDFVCYQEAFLDGCP